MSLRVYAALVSDPVAGAVIIAAAVPMVVYSIGVRLVLLRLKVTGLHL